MFNQNPEQIARDAIDGQLRSSGWIVQNKDAINFAEGQGQAVREYHTDTGPADYVLFVEECPVGVIEAKKESLGQSITTVEDQTAEYASAKLKWVQNTGRPLPFLYEATGVLIRFTDQRDPKPRSREVFSFHRPETLREWLGQGRSLRDRLRDLPPMDTAGLRDCQVEAITRLDESLRQAKPRALIQMATGSGKTFTAITAIYRLLKHSRVRRVLFLVDTRNLGEQTEQEFLAYTPNDDNRKFTELYTVARLNSSHVPADAEVCISTIQRMYSILQNRDLDESAEDENPAERSDPRREHDAWQQGIRILNPSHAELERGLALHRQLAVCENYGFLPKVRTTELEQSLSALMDRGLGWPEWKRKARVRRVTAAARDADGAREFFQLVEESGITCLIQSVNFMGESLDDTILILAAYRHLCNTFKDRLLQATCAEDIERAKAAGQTGLFFSLTGFPMAGAGGLADLDGLLDWVDAWYHLGVRFMHLGYNRRNAFADGCLEVNDDGLSDLGAALVRRMNATGVVVDIPHSSTRTTFDTAKVTTKPILASHVGCASVHRHRRCKTDEELKAIADTGGYVGIFSVPGFLGPRADLNTLLVHIQHALQVVGPDHVAVGTDVEYGQNWPEGLPAIPVRHGLNPLGKNPDPPMSPAPEPYPEGCGRVMPTPPLS